ncbi:MAG: SDR family oxidoreductase [Myxococcota bacterium]
MNAWRMDGRRVVVTGGSKGIGAAIVAELCGLGAEVLAVARTPADLEMLADRTGCATLAADVRDTDRIVDAVRARWDGLDGLVNNAGINIRRSIADTTPNDLSTILAVNLESVFALTQRLHPSLVARRGAVVNLTSVASERAVRTSTPTYAASKGGIDALTRFLAASWGPDGVRVNGVAPWYVRTPLAEAVLADPAKRQSILDRTPLGRLGEPEDVARAVAWLLMPASSWVTGAIVPVDGGFTALGS